MYEDLKNERKSSIPNGRSSGIEFPQSEPQTPLEESALLPVFNPAFDSWEECKQKLTWVKDYIYRLAADDEIYNLSNTETHPDLTKLIQEEKLISHQLNIIHDILNEAGEAY